jgi:hypothetical protein
MNRTCVAATAMFLLASSAHGDLRQLVPEHVLEQIAAEVSGEEAKRSLDYVTTRHRMRASEQFDDATQFIVGRLNDYGLDEVETLDFAADGETMFGTQKSRPVWSVQFAELWELETQGGEQVRSRRLGSWEAMPLSLAQDSLRRERGARKTGPDIQPAWRRRRACSRRTGCCRHRLVCTESTFGVVETGRPPGSLGTPEQLPGHAVVRFHDLARRGASPAGAHAER